MPTELPCSALYIPNFPWTAKDVGPAHNKSPTHWIVTETLSRVPLTGTRVALDVGRNTRGSAFATLGDNNGNTAVHRRQFDEEATRNGS